MIKFVNFVAKSNSKQTMKNIHCTQPLLPELPEMLFGEDEVGEFYFDLSKFAQGRRLSDKENASNYKWLVDMLKPQIEAHADRVGLDCRQMILEQEGSYLVHSSLAYVFAMHVDPFFSFYVSTIMNSLSTDGFAVSDTLVYRLAQERLPIKYLQQIINTNNAIE